MHDGRLFWDKVKTTSVTFCRGEYREQKQAKMRNAFIRKRAEKKHHIRGKIKGTGKNVNRGNML